MRIIGSDYDGTLNHGGIDEKKKNAIEKWRSKGNAFVIVSGRGPDSVLDICKEKQFGCDYLIANNGALILKTDGSIISDVRCSGELIVPLLKALFKNGCPHAFVQSESLYKVSAAEKTGCDVPEYTLEDIPDTAYFNQISTILPDYETAEKVTANIQALFGNYLNPLQNGVCIDIVSADINKAKGLYILADILGVKFEDIIAVGDNINDRDMIKEFRSYAMENGVESIKKLADEITPGVAELIEKELSE